MREITSEQRNRIVSLLKSGKSNRKVAESVGVSLGTVFNVGKSSCPDRERSKGGRPKVLSPADQRYCVRLATKQGMDNAVKVRKQLRTEINAEYSMILVTNKSNQYKYHLSNG